MILRYIPNVLVYNGDNFGTKEVRQYRLTNIESEEDGYKLFVDEELLFIIPILKDVDES